MSEIDYKKRCDEYEKMLGIGKYDIPRKAFFALCKIVESQTNRLNKFNLDTEIVKDAKEDKVYDRTKAIWEGLPKMITDINSLRKDLNIKEIDIVQQLGKQMTTAESIADVLTDRTGQEP